MENDLISRHGVSAWLANMGYSKLADVVMDEDRFPPAQPKRTDKRTEKHACDCISRKAAIDEIVNTVSEIGLHDNSEVARYGATFRQHEIIDIIEGMPSAQPERMRGTWIEDDDGWDEVIWRCSECDAVFTLVDGTPEENEYYFCPNCGADMRGEQDG